MERKKKKLGIGLIAAMILAIVIFNLAPGLQAAEPASTFSDIAASDPDLAYIKYLASQDIIKGYPDGSFQPQTGLTRAQAAVVMVKTGKAALNPDAASPFKDLPKDHWARAYVAAAVKAGYISGYPDGTFKPDQQLSRAQGISLLLKLSQQPQTAVLPALKDINSQHWAAQAVAVGLASGMAGLSADGQNYYPDGPFTRINMAHALGILLTEDPTLNASSLPGKLKAVQGKTTIIKAGTQDEEELKTETTVNPGDSIVTAKGASAELSYPDGSSMLIKEDSKVSVKEAKGRKYIKTNGQEGIAIDWLNLDMKQGTMFTALATKHEGTESSSTTTEKKTSQTTERTIASLAGRDYIAEAAQETNKDMPWYEASKTKKVKVKVDMPWGVAAVRGTFVMISVSPSGQASVSCLNGNAEVTNGGQTVPLGQNQSTQVTTENAPPPTPAPMAPAVVQLFDQVKTWIEATAKTMDQNQEQAAPPPPPALIEALQEVLAPVQQTPIQSQTQTNPAPNNAMTALQAINQALGNIGISVGNNAISFQTNSNQTSNSGGSSTPTVVENALGQLVTVTSGTPLNFTGGMKINLGTMIIPAGATVKVENGIPSQLGDLQTAGLIVSVQFANLTINQPVEISLPVNAGIDSSKAGIYYYNESTAKWEYQTCRLENGVLKASVSHFSVYGVLLDTTAPASLSLQAGIPTSSSVALNYSAQDSSGVTSYELYRDETLIYNGSAASYTDSNLIAGHTYSYQFKAIDVRGNTSALSSAVTVQAPALPTVQIIGLQDISTSNGYGSIDYQVSPADAAVTYSYNPVSGFGTSTDGTGTNPQDRWWRLHNASQSVTVTVTAGKEGHTPASQSFTVNYVPPAAPPSNLCQITTVNSPGGAVFNGQIINTTVGNCINGLSVVLTVSPQATWKLYSDNDYVNEIGNRQVSLIEGSNYSYIEVIAEDGVTTARYTLVITRAAASVQKVTGITVAGAGGVTSIGIGGKLQMAAVCTPIDAVDKSVTWSVVYGAVTAAIDANGLLTGTREGTATVKAVANDGSLTEGTTAVSITEFAGGTGTPADPYQIATAEQLNNVRKYLNSNYIMIADIDLANYLSVSGAGYNSNKGWIPIGVFTGLFDGNGHTIDHLFVTCGNSDSYRGLFSTLSGQGTVKNLGLLNVSITGTGVEKIGAIAGMLNNTGYVFNCYTTGSIICTGGDVGGVVGLNFSGVINGCSSSVNVTGGWGVGGISGGNYHSGAYPSLQNCYATGNIAGNERVGGITGWAKSGTISSSYATGNVSGKKQVGGLVGYQESECTLKNSFALNSNVSRTTGTEVTFGRFVGERAGGAVANCYANSAMSINPSTYSGVDGTDISLTNARQKSTYSSNGWYIDNMISSTTTVWVIDDGSLLPTLRVQNYSADVYADAASFANAAVLPPVMSGTVSITGTSVQGQTLTVNSSGLTYTPVATANIPTYQWKRDGVVIPGATGSTYALVANDVGKAITVTVAADGTHARGCVTSGATANVTDTISTIATLSDLTAAGTTVPGFVSTTFTYNVDLPAGTTIVPNVIGTVTDTGKASAAVTPAANLPGSTTVVVTAEDGTTQQTYTIHFSVAGVTRLSALPIGTVVYDSSASWEHKTGDGYTGSGAIQPVEWKIVAKDHPGYPADSVTLLSQEIIAKYAYDNDNSRWDESGIRSWLNGTFYNHLSSTFKAAVQNTDVANYVYSTATAGTTIDRIFLPSITELGEAGDVPVIGTDWGYFKNDPSRIAFIGGTALNYLTRSPFSGNQVGTIQWSDGNFASVYLVSGNQFGARPVLNLNANTCVRLNGELAPVVIGDLQGGAIQAVVAAAGRSYIVTTINIPDNQPATVTWYADANKTSNSNTSPAGIAVTPAANVCNNVLTLNVAVTETAPTVADNYYFTVTVAGVESAVKILNVTP